MRVSAAILAGGKSSRFGSDKASYNYRDKMLIAWVAESLADCDETMIIGPQAYGLTLPWYADEQKNLGPMAGLYVALQKAKHPWVALAACDMPFLSKAYWQFLWGYAEGKTGGMVVVETGGGLEPLAALYHRSLLPKIHNLLAQNKLKMINLCADDTTMIPWSVTQRYFPQQHFANINSLQDLC